MNTEITLRKHLSNIAIQRHKDLKKKLGKEGYSKYMQKISLARFDKKKEVENQNG